MTAVYLVRHAQPVYQGYQETPELPAGGADAGAAGPAAGPAH